MAWNLGEDLAPWVKYYEETADGLIVIDSAHLDNASNAALIHELVLDDGAAGQFIEDDYGINWQRDTLTHIRFTLTAEASHGFKNKRGMQ